MTMKPVTISLFNFKSADEQIIRSSFAHAEHWLLPYHLVDDIDEAQVILSNLNDHDDISILAETVNHNSEARFIIFANDNPEKGGWFLKRKLNGRFSLIDFSSLLLDVSTAIANNQNQPLDINAISSVSPASSGSGVMPFLDRITSLLDGSSWEKKKKFNDK